MDKYFRQNTFTSSRKKYAKSSTKGLANFVKVDSLIVIFTIIFVCFGLVFTYSSSAFKDSTYFFSRQLFFVFIGLILMGFLSQYYHKIQRKINPTYIILITWILLIIPLFMSPIAHVHRWIHLGPINIQPSEIAKLSLLIYLAHFLNNTAGKINRSYKPLLPALIVVFITLGLISMAPDLGTPSLMFWVFILMLFVAGAKIRYILSLLGASMIFGIYLIMKFPYRVERIFAFISPEGASKEAGYQLVQSSLAIGSGGWFGKGLGNSQIKLEYLPAAHTDFIFSIMAEEAGMIVMFLVIFLFCAFLCRGIALAKSAKDHYNSFLIFGITITIIFQAFFNMGVALGLVPTKGLPLPFFSYGGSSILITLAMIGILLNVASVEVSAAYKMGRRKFYER